MTTDPGSGAREPYEPAPPGTGAGASPEAVQSMLSRAVEGQLNEQRELMSAISDMRTQLMRFGQELAELRVRPPQDEASDAAINNVTVEMREAVRFLSERLDGVTRVVAQRGEELGDIRTALTAIDAHARSQAETLGVLSAGLQALPSYGERVSALQDSVQTLHAQLSGIERSVEAATAGQDDDRLAGIEESLAQVREGGSAQAAALAQMQAATSGLHQAIAEVHAGLDPIASDVTAIGSGVTGLVEGAADGAAMDARVTESVQAAVRGLEQRLTDHVDKAVLALAETLLRRRPAGGAGGHAPAAGFDEPEPSYGAQAPEPEPGSSYGAPTTEPASSPQWSTPGRSAEAGGTTEAADDVDDLAAEDIEVELDEPDAVGLGDDDIVADDLDVSDDLDRSDDLVRPDEVEGDDTVTDASGGAGASPAGSAWWERDVTTSVEGSTADADGDDTDEEPTGAADDAAGEATQAPDRDYWAKPFPEPDPSVAEAPAPTFPGGSDDLDRTGEISPTPLQAWSPQTPSEHEAGESSEADGTAEPDQPEVPAKRKRRWRRG